MGLALFGLVPMKMLPFDNKNEMQLVVDMPEGTTLEETDRVVRELGAFLRTVPEVADYESYVGTSSPHDFNGLARHYFLRRGGHLADIRVNLVGKHDRTQQSHAIALRIRRDLEAIARRHGAAMKLVEVPPGPPVIATIVAEIYGTPDRAYDDLIRAATKKRKPQVKGKKGEKGEEEDKKQEAIDRITEVLTSAEQDYDPLWGSTLKQALRRVYPGFSESYYGYGSFSELLEDLKARGFIELEYDDSRGNYKVRRKRG